MNTQQKIARLEDLLARIHHHAGEPRAAAPIAPVMVAHAPAVVASAPPAAAAPVMVHAAEPVMPALDPITTPPPSNPDYGSDSDVEVSSEVVEVDIDIDEPAVIAAESGVNELIEIRQDEEYEEPAPNTQSSSEPPMEDEVRAATPANEIEEPSPSSSRRPIAGEERPDTYEDESSPRHTPPPESGKQVAPSIAPKPSVPPPSLEGHTLIGGWREPGAGGAPNISAGYTTGVRAPSPIAAAPLSAEVSKPTFPASAHVASIEGAAPVFKPANFGDLLDATLGL